MEVAVVASLVSVDVAALEVVESDITDRDDEVAYHEDAQGEDDGSMEIGSQETLVAYAAAEDGDDFGVTCQFGGEEESGDEDEERAVEVEEVGDEIEVVLEDYLAERGFVLEEVVKFFGDIEGDDDDEDDGEPEEEGSEILSKDVAVYEGIVEQSIKLKVER